MTHLTHSTRPASEKLIDRKWHLVDVSGKRLGRAANAIVAMLQGKEKLNYAPNIDGGDYVVVVNAKAIVLSGHKADTKTYAKYSGYPGGLRKIPFKTYLETRPEEVIRRAVSGMLPKNKLRDRRLARLHVYPENKHPYANKVTS